MSEKHPSRSEPIAELVDLCRARLLALADRLQAVEEEARAELREVAAALGEPADYEAFLDHQIPGTPHYELYRCAESFELGAGARTTLTHAAAAPPISPPRLVDESQETSVGVAAAPKRPGRTIRRSPLSPTGRLPERARFRRRGWLTIGAHPP